MLAIPAVRGSPSHRLVPVVVLCLLELVLVGRPMFRFGFDRLANANGDMAYYVLSRVRIS